MRVKLAPLISAISAIAVLSVSSTYAAVTIADNGGLSAATPLANKATIVAQAWWDAAANAANTQQQVTTGQGPPPVRRGTQRYAASLPDGSKKPPTAVGGRF
jgi:hypothetical protein